MWFELILKDKPDNVLTRVFRFNVKNARKYFREFIAADPELREIEVENFAVRIVQYEYLEL